jgi:hypothetical protein
VVTADGRSNVRSAIATPYDTSVRPAWTLSEPISQRVRHINQTGSGGSYFAIITLVFEPLQAASPIMFASTALPQVDAISPFYLEDLREIGMYGDIVKAEIEMWLAERYQQQQAIMHLSITLTELLIHPVDSNARAYRHAVRIAMDAVFRPPALVPVELFQAN